jgi:hypothetical protein
MQINHHRPPRQQRPEYEGVEVIQVQQIRRFPLKLLADYFADGAAIVPAVEDVGLPADSRRRCAQRLFPPRPLRDNCGIYRYSLLLQSVTSSLFAPPDGRRYQTHPKGSREGPEHVVGAKMATRVERPGQFARDGEERLQVFDLN